MTCWAIYQRRSLADVQAIETMLGRLRLVVDSFGAEVAYELHDTAERQQWKRPGRKQLDALIAQGEVTGVVISDLHRPFKSLVDLAYGLSRWLDLGVRVVVVSREVDTANPSHLVELRDHLRWMKDFETSARQERGLLSALHRHRPATAPPLVSDLEIANLMRQGYSQNGIIQFLRRSERRLGKETVGKAVRRVLASGEVSSSIFEAAKAKRAQVRRKAHGAPRSQGPTSKRSPS
ncbi:MAG: recombinase family protein [Deltaproteobacteria bacterium]|nr:recombinase family protein [Deltaproteobacteria bacterium]